MSWPRNVPLEIAIASRIAMLSAASSSCQLDGRTEDQDMLLDLVHRSTNARHVEGQSFPQFLTGTTGGLRQLAEEQQIDLPAVEQTIKDIEACEPRDVVGEIYESLLQLTSEIYEEALGEQLDPSLQRIVLARRSTDHPFNLSGEVPPSRDVVMLNLYAGKFDLLALALVPRVLAHELICHVAARHVGIWKHTPDPDFRSFFSDGFMDCAARRLLLMWLEADALPHATPVSHLSEAEIPYAYLRLDVFKAGQGAWGNCSAKTNMRLPSDPPKKPSDRAHRRASCEEAVIGAALRINACGCHIEPKDRFVHLARQATPAVTERFADVAVGKAKPSDLLAELIDGRP